MNKLTSPTSDEYSEFYAGYIQRAQAIGNATGRAVGLEPPEVASLDQVVNLPP